MERILNPKRNISKGFTLVELLIVLVVVGILSGSVMLMSNNVLNRTKVNADIATVRSLNTATVIYKTMGNLYLNSDTFYGFNNDQDRIQELLKSGQINSTPVPNVSETSFSWNIASQKWVISVNATPPEPPDPPDPEKPFVVGENEGVKMVPGDHDEFNRLEGSYKGEHKDIVIPEKFFDGSLIKEISKEVFLDKGLTSVVFEDGLIRIYDAAFKGNDLKEIVFPKSLLEIGPEAFAKNNLKTITIGEGIGKGVKIGENAFAGQGVETKIPFEKAYAEGGAGTYNFEDGCWVKQK